MRPQVRSSLVFIIILGLILAALGLTYINFLFAVNNLGGRQYLPRWIGARSWIKEGTSPYSEQVSQATQQTIYGRLATEGEDPFDFLYPLTTMAVFAPLGLLEYPLSQAIWMTFLEASLVAVGLLSLKLVNWKIRPLLAVAVGAFCVVWFHGILTVWDGQIAPVSAVFLTVGLLLVLQRQDIAGGFFIALATLKPTMVFLLIPFVLLWAISTRRTQLFWSIVTTGFVIFLATLPLLPTWPVAWVQQLVRFPTYALQESTPLAILAGLMPGIRQPVIIFLYSTLAIYLLVEWYLAWGKDERWFLWTAMLTIVVSNLAGYRTGLSNYVMLIPVMVLIFYSWDQRWKNSGKVLFVVTAIVLGGGLWLLGWKSLQADQAHPVLYFPFPLLCIAGLWWVRWWWVRPAKLSLQDLANKM